VETQEVWGNLDGNDLKVLVDSGVGGEGDCGLTGD